MRYAVAYVLGAFRACPAPRVGSAVAGRPPYRCSEVLPLALGDDAAKMAALHTVATSCDPPLASGRWRVLGADLRRAIASRRAVPADVKDQTCLPLHPSSHGECWKVYPIPQPVSSGKCVFWKLWVGYFERWSRLCAAKMAALHAAVAGRASFHRSQQAATLPLAATSAAVPAAARRGRLTLPQRARRPLSQ